MFRISIAPIVRIFKRIPAASGTGHMTYLRNKLGASDLNRPRWRKVVAQISEMTCSSSCIYSLCIPDDGFNAHQIYVEEFRINKNLHTVES